MTSILSRESISSASFPLQAEKTLNQSLRDSLVKFNNVSDDGPGVPEGQQNKIFQAFYQLPDDPVATSTGTGIGFQEVN